MKNYFLNLKFFLTSVIYFICFFCNVNLFNVNVSINYSLAENYDDFYNYNLRGRENKEDELLKNSEVTKNEAKISGVMQILKMIPGLNSFATPIAYLVVTGMLQSGSSGALNILGGGGGIEAVLVVLGTIGDILSINQDQSNKSIALQTVFGSNLYCRYQRVYQEEENYITKSAPTNEGGLEYPVFPVYPLKIDVNESTGQCDLNSSTSEFKTFFAKGETNATNTENILNTSESKCSFSYSATSQQCVQDLDLPLLTEYKIQEGIIEGFCFVSGFAGLAKKAFEKGFKMGEKKALKKMVKELDDDIADTIDVNDAAQVTEALAEKKLKEEGKELTTEAIEKKSKELNNELKDSAQKAGEQAEKASKISQATDYVITLGEGVASYFTDARFVFDPINFLAVLNLENFFDFLSNSLQDIATAALSGGIAALVEIVPCVAARAAGLAALQSIGQTIIAPIISTKYEMAKTALPNYKFCGYDWLSYKKTEDGKYWMRGLFEHSYYKKVFDCINTTNCNVTNEVACSDGANFCSENNKRINAKSKNIKNKLFREYTYGGKEYISGFQEYNLDSKNDNRLMVIMDYLKNYCIDPRTSDAKGFLGVEQRYYMKGNEKANFACNRFFYDGKSGCLLAEDQVRKEDRDGQKLRVTSVADTKYYSGIIIYLENKQRELLNDDNLSDEDKVEMIQQIKSVEKELGALTYYEIPSDNVELLQTYSKECEKSFIEARKCCKYRSKNFICLENVSSKNNTFCFSNVIKNYSGEDIASAGMIDFLNKVNKGFDNFKEVCKLDGVSFEASKKKNTDYVCVFSYGLCPYDFKLNAGLNYKASYCDGNYFEGYQDPVTILQRGPSHLNVDDCRKGLFGAGYREQYKANFSSGGNLYAAFVYDKVRNDRENFNDSDFNTIYNFGNILKLLDELSDGTIDANGKDILKHVLHCDPDKGYEDCSSILKHIREDGYVIDKSLAIDKDTHFTYNIPTELLGYIKTSAYGKVKNFCQYRAHCVEVEKEDSYDQNLVDKSLFLDNSCGRASVNSRNILQNNNGGVPRQLSAPIVECIFESLKNLINGVAGNSLCASNMILNNEGYCGSDTEELIKKKMNSGIDAKNYFNSRYQKLDGQFIIKGYNLPISYNPFLKLQKYFINIIKAALTLFLVIYFYTQLLTGKIGDFTKAENMSKLVFNTFKFALIIWLIFYAGWQQGVYNRVVNFSVGVYSFVNNLFIKSVNNPKNQLLNLDGVLSITLTKEAAITIDYRDGINEDNSNVYLCYKYDIFNNIDYSLVKEDTRGCERGYRKKNSNIVLIKKNKNPSTQPEENLIISNNQEISRLIYFVDKYNETANQKILIEGLDNIWNKYYDGCYFDPTEYEENKNYLAVFDMLDCKFIKYLGYSTQSMVPNLIFLSLIGLVPGYFLKDTVFAKIFSGLGSALFGAMMSFLFIIFNLLIKIVYIFLSSFFTLSLLIFISPIILPLVFYERTKKIVDTWLENIVDMIFKPALNLGMIIIYINLLDMILLKGVTFAKHSSKGRGPNVICSDDVFSFMCFLNSPDPIFTKIELINKFGLFPVLIDLLVVVLLFVLSDSILAQIEDISKQLFTFSSDPAKTPTFSSSDAMGEGNSISGSAQSAMSFGKDINSFRENYVNKVPGALASKVVRGADNLLEHHNADNFNKDGSTKHGKVYNGIIGASKLIAKTRNKVEFVDDNIKNRTEKNVSKAKDFVKNKSIKSKNFLSGVENRLNIALAEKLDEKYDKKIEELEKKKSRGANVKRTNRKIENLKKEKIRLEEVKKTATRKESERKAEEKGDLYFDYNFDLEKSFDEMNKDYQNKLAKKELEKEKDEPTKVTEKNNPSNAGNESSSGTDNENSTTGRAAAKKATPKTPTVSNPKLPKKESSSSDKGEPNEDESNDSNSKK